MRAKKRVRVQSRCIIIIIIIITLVIIITIQRNVRNLKKKKNTETDRIHTHVSIRHSTTIITYAARSVMKLHTGARSVTPRAPTAMKYYSVVVGD